ncbi:MAG: Diguanylate cyclase [Candidatus Gallionella acididurans]|uniref:diguanylate cyclase n=1 Tax=Candidatus Gallionella acididurans TaxID=1796491 RepID=A0A139BX71_9PROT|nr:MAG: Diguanylate cyclase [Candidatus Gallionella acididurans]
MNLDPRTLLFSLILTCGLSVLGMFVAATCRSGGRTRDGMGKWAAAMFLQTLTWGLVAARGTIPDFLSVIAANGFLAASYALMLVAIHEFQQRQLPRWQYLVPVALILVISAILPDNIRSRFIWDGVIYALQMVLIARALLSDRKTRSGQAWRLLFGGIVMLVLVLGLRGAVALSGHTDFAQPQNTAGVQPIQIIAFIAAMSTALLGSIGFVLLVKERTDREVMLLAMTDSLTQIPNRRALMDYAQHALARRNGLPLALLMIDVDHFKLINDTHGHQTGDEVLSKIPVLLAGRLRGYDYLGRYGGEEFCVVAPDTGAAGALELAESLRETIASTVLNTECGEISVSVSIGVSCCRPDAAPELKTVLAEADAALYDAKHSGRNKVVCFGGEKV